MKVSFTMSSEERALVVLRNTLIVKYLDKKSQVDQKTSLQLYVCFSGSYLIAEWLYIDKIMNNLLITQVPMYYRLFIRLEWSLEWIVKVEYFTKLVRISKEVNNKLPFCTYLIYNLVYLSKWPIASSFRLENTYSTL